MNTIKQRLYLIFSIVLIGLTFSSDAQASERLIPSYLPVKHGEIEYYRFGEGDPIVLINGYGNNVSSWNRHFLNELSRQHEVIIFNNRNVGGSVIRSASYTSLDLANDTWQLIEGLHLQQPTILGFSMGGMIAQQVTILHPKEIKNLILLNTAMAGSQAVAPDNVIQDTMFNPPANALKRDTAIIKILSPRGWRLHTALSLEFDKFKPDQIEPLPSKAILNKQRQLIVDWSNNNDAAKQIARLDLPVLILNGGSDQILPPKNSDVLFHNIHTAKLVRWQDGGHSMIFQHPREIAYVINDFLI